MLVSSLFRHGEARNFPSCMSLIESATALLSAKIMTGFFASLRRLYSLCIASDIASPSSSQPCQA